MTTELFDNKMCTFKILLSWRFPRKQRFGRFSSLPPKVPPLLKNRKFNFYCCLAVSEFKTIGNHVETNGKLAAGPVPGGGASLR